MKSFACAGVAALVFAFGSGALAAEKVLELDASGGTSTGHWVMILSKGTAPSVPTGTAAIVVGNGDKFEGAYGFNLVDGQPVNSAIAEAVIKSERASEKEPAASTIIVKVTAVQHDAVKKIIDTWSGVKEHIDPANDVAVNFAQEVVAALKMKRAFRGGLAPINPIQYYSDLGVVNRKLGQKAS